jgi:ferredoxin-NADP reductase
MEEIVKILSVTPVTHDVRSYRIAKPAGYHFEPGQATDVSINKDKWKDEKRPFTFTGLAEWPHLEFTIKSYNDHQGVTHELGRLQAGDELIIREPWGAISYKGEGYFIAGGAGITPFIAILRRLHQENKIGGNQLFFSNKTAGDIILREELDSILGSNAHYILTRGENTGAQTNTGVQAKKYIDRDFLKKEINDLNRPCYICGPDKMVSDLTAILSGLGADPESLVFEK